MERRKGDREKRAEEDSVCVCERELKVLKETPNSTENSRMPLTAWERCGLTIPDYQACHTPSHKQTHTGQTQTQQTHHSTHTERDWFEKHMVSITLLYQRTWIKRWSIDFNKPGKTSLNEVSVLRPTALLKHYITVCLHIKNYPMMLCCSFFMDSKRFIWLLCADSHSDTFSNKDILGATAAPLRASALACSHEEGRGILSLW